MAKGEKIYLATKQELQEVAANAGTKVQEITQEAYNALSEEDKNKSDVIYRITDADSTAVLISMQLGETATTAYAGNKGKALADKVGNTNISNIGDGTITNAIKTLSDNSMQLGETTTTAYAGNKGKALADKIGTTDISEVADGTLTGAVLDLATNKGGGVVDITQAEYNALSSEEKQKDIFYRLTDVEDAGVKALLIGETSTSAFAGNRGKALEDTVNNDCLKGGVITGTLSSGDTSVTLTSNKITSNSIIDIYSSKYGVSPSEVSVETGSITLTFDEAQSEDVGIKVIILNGGE